MVPRAATLWCCAVELRPAARAAEALAAADGGAWELGALGLLACDGAIGADCPTGAKLQVGSI